MNFRQQKIYQHLRTHQNVHTSDLKKMLENMGITVSTMTITRDLDLLQKEGFVVSHGKARAICYNAKEQSKGNMIYSVEKYFSIPQDLRTVLPFSLDAFDIFENIFSSEEKKRIDTATERYQKKVSALSEVQLQKEIERLTIDLSWKSSEIEGNTYDLIDTEMLITEHQEAKGHTKQEAIMILNHKKALDMIFTHQQEYSRIDQKKIEDLHRILIQDLGVKAGFREKSVRITGSNYIPPKGDVLIPGIIRLVEVVNMLEHPVEKAFALLVLHSYLQPFDDGNKRTARILSNAILVAHQCCPLSYRSVNPTEYKKTLLLFYEQQSFANFKNLFLEQYLFATENYFVV